jgi:tetraacyldisaccharide 4'-kinase
VVSVGNLTVGGSGKTPLVSALARELLRKGKRAAVLSRGYGRRSSSPFVLVSDGTQILASPDEAGDEPIEIALANPSVPVAVGRDRVAAGRELLDRLGPHFLLLDDGFQHRRLHRDLDLVCFDAAEPLESLELLPFGRLREPLASLSRAHAIVWTRWREGSPGEELRRLVARGNPELPSIRCRTRITGFERLSGTEIAGPETFRGQPVGLLAGVARPERVLDSLGTLTGRIVFRRFRRDHHAWKRDELSSLSRHALRAGAIALLTTGKDAVKMSFADLALPLYAIRMEAEILDLDVLERLLRKVAPT